MATGVVEKVASEGALIDMRSIRRSVGPQVIETSQSKGSQSTMQVRKSKKVSSFAFTRMGKNGSKGLLLLSLFQLRAAKSTLLWGSGQSRMTF